MCVKNYKEYVRQEVVRIETNILCSQEQKKEVLCSMFVNLDSNL